MSDESPLLTREQVATWVSERADVARKHTELGARLADLDRKLEAVSFLLPEKAAEALLHPETVVKRSEATFTELVLEVLGTGDRGYTPAEVRAALFADPDPELVKKVRRSHNGVPNALHRLLGKEDVVRVGARYYLPLTYQRIQSGEIQPSDEPDEEPVSFNGRMHAIMRAHCKPFTAKEANEVARSAADLSGDVSKQPSRIYSWLSREVFRGKLLKDGALYYYPSQQDEALNSHAVSAPTVAGEAPTSPIESQAALRLIG